jgi:hypothetical protein
VTAEKRAWTPEALRRAALDAIDAHADERVRDALLHGSLAIATAVARWEGSSGPVVGHRVTLALDAARLGGLRAAPAVADAIGAALAAAIATQPGEALLGLVPRWSGEHRAAAAGYRDAAPSTDALHDALVEYLIAVGEQDVARAVAAAVTEAAPAEVRLRVAPGRGGRLRSDAHAMAALAGAVRALTGDDRARVVVQEVG